MNIMVRRHFIHVFALHEKYFRFLKIPLDIRKPSHYIL